MKFLFTVFLLHLLFSNIQNNSTILGEWRHNDSKTYWDSIRQSTISVIDDCDNYIKFTNDGKYFAHDNGECDALESGEYSIESNKLFLRERIFAANHYIYSPDKELQLDILSLTSNELKIKYKDNKADLYKRSN